MSSSAEVLVVILSIVLAVFLFLGIILMIYLIVLTHKIRKITKAAEDTIENVGSIFSGVAKVLSPKFIASMVEKAVDKLSKAKAKSKAKDEKEEEK